jgi:SAM-dependent methyltransferase
MSQDAPDDLLARIDTTLPHSARRYDYLLGGTNNFAADRASAAVLEEAIPTMRRSVQENRAFLRRAVDVVARAGIRQFLDIGSGLPTSPNVHEIAQTIDPTSRVVYVDNDPIVLVHARALLTSSPQGASTYLDADLRRPDEILTHPELLSTLDLTEPVGLIFVGILQYFLDGDDPHALVARLASALVPGSYLVIAHGSYDWHPEYAALADAAMRASGLPMRSRTRAEILEFFEGFDLIEPGITGISQWRDESEPLPRPDPGDMGSYGAVGVKRG